jgi:hypothetical protein
MDLTEIISQRIESLKLQDGELITGEMSVTQGHFANVYRGQWTRVTGEQPIYVDLFLFILIMVY